MLLWIACVPGWVLAPDAPLPHTDRHRMSTLLLGYVARNGTIKPSILIFTSSSNMMSASNSCSHSDPRRTLLPALVLLLSHAPHLVNARLRGSSSTSRGRRLAGGAIAGIVIGIIAAVLLCMILACLLRRRRRARGGVTGTRTGFAPFGARQAGNPAATDYEAGGGYFQGANTGYEPGGVGTGAGSYAPPTGAPPGAAPPPYAGANKEAAGAGVGGFAPPPGPPPPPNAHVAQNNASGRFSNGWFGNGNKAQ